MNVGRPQGRVRATGIDAISQLDEALRREELRRHQRAKMALATAAVTLVLAATTGVLMMRGSASAADRAAAAPARAKRATEVITPATVEETTSALATEASITSASKPTPGREKHAPSTRVGTPVAKAAVSAKAPVATSKRAASSGSVQRVRIAIGGSGFVPSVVTVSAARPVVLSVGRGQGCAAGFLIRKLGINKDNSGGPVSISLGRVAAGSYQFSCGMEMVTGTLIAK